MVDSRQVFEWLVDGAPGAAGAPEVVDGLGERLVAGGVPLHRIAAFVRTLHPEIMGRRFIWERGAGVQVHEAPYQTLSSATFIDSPVAAVYRTGEPIRRRLLDPSTPRDYTVLHELAAQGITDYLIGPLTFLSGQVHAIAFASKDPRGFDDAHVATLLDVLRPLSRLAEVLALRRTAVNLLDTYVGRNAGERVLAGKIVRGDVETIRAVIWFSDLRGFTALASRVSPSALIGALNDLFDCQVPVIQRHGGEVLKFIGDGLLAIFPFDPSTSAGAERCDAALDAARAAFAGLATLNRTRAARADDELRFGVALHPGDVAYGNVGSSGRLDFTCIGPAVNLASRLEGLTGRLDRPLIVSDEFARLSTRPTVPVGTFELKGVPEPRPVFAPAAGQPLAGWSE